MGGSSVAMLAPYGGRLGLGRLLPNRIRCTSLGIFCTVSLCVFRVCDRTLRPFPVGGPFPCQQTYSFNPARPSTASLAGKMPPLREGDRYFLGCAYWHSYCSPPSSYVRESRSRNPYLLNPVGSAGFPLVYTG